MTKRKRRSGRTFIQRSRERTAEQKAYFHQVEGAGKARVLRPFLDLTPEEERAVQQRIEDLIDRELRRKFGGS